MHTSKKRPKLTVELRGGLANQLFEYSVGLIVAKDANAQLRLDARSVNRGADRGYQLAVFNKDTLVIDNNFLVAALWRFAIRRLPENISTILAHYIRPTWAKKTRDLDVAVKRLARGKNVTIVGYLQEVALIVENTKFLRQYFRLGQDSFLGKDEVEQTGHLAVHVRRGDYVENERLRDFFLPPNLEYYLAAIEHSSFSKVLIVSDDLEWCQKILRPRISAAKTVSFSTGANHFEDLFLLANSEELVCSNSTFSWWSAFLGRATTVIVPQPWHNNGAGSELSLDGWKKLDRRNGKLFEQ